MKSYFVVVTLSLSLLGVGAKAADGPSKLSHEKLHQLSEVLKGMQVVAPALRALKEDGAIQDPDLKLKIEDLKALADYIQKLPLADQVLIEEAALTQLAFIVEKSRERKRSHEDDMNSPSHSKYAVPAVGAATTQGAYTVLRSVGKWSLGKISNSSWFSGPESKKSIWISAGLSIAAAYYVYTLTAKERALTAIELIKDQMELDELDVFVQTRLDALETKKEALQLQTPQ